MLLFSVCVDESGTLDLKHIPRVSTTALNRADLLQKRGLYPPPSGESEILGLEASGVITDIGPGVKENWKLGSKVRALLGGGGYAEYVAVPEEHVMPVPSPLTLYQSAALPEAWLTAYQLLHFIGNMMSASVRFQYSLKVSNGADVILDCVGGYFWKKNICSITIDGRWVLYGMLGGKTADGDLLGKLLRKRGNLLCSLLRSRRLQYKVELVRSFTEQVLSHFKSTDPPLWPVIDSMFNMEDVEMAHQRMQANKNIGKIIIKIINS
uniref:Tumor protein p53 inducible protein 3 n=1 Tax=Cyprinus carpio TaxID=7962 RepID=A0A8C1RYF0_CYPCA